MSEEVKRGQERLLGVKRGSLGLERFGDAERLGS
jgi:hypothetical protein